MAGDPPGQVVGMSVRYAECAAGLDDLGIKMIFLIAQDLNAVAKAYGQRSPRHVRFRNGATFIKISARAPARAKGVVR